jgi:hypothetical protein
MRQIWAVQAYLSASVELAITCPLSAGFLGGPRSEIGHEAPAAPGVDTFRYLRRYLLYVHRSTANHLPLSRSCATTFLAILMV